MPEIRPIPAIEYDLGAGGDLSSRIAPPYDVLNEQSKAALLTRDRYNIVEVDLPHLPPKTVGPDAAYERAAATFNQWLEQGVLKRRDRPAVYVYQQTYTVAGRRYQRRGVIANVTLQAFGAARTPGVGGIFPHEQTFSEPKEDRLKLMRATRAQLSPIFGLYADPRGEVAPLIDKAIGAAPASFHGSTAGDGVLHEVWTIEDHASLEAFAATMRGCDTFIADGHHRYTTALNYQQELNAASGPLPAGHPANACLFVLVALQDPGLIVLPTHRVLGGMSSFSMVAFTAAARGALHIEPFKGNLAALEKALPKAGHHAVGLYDPANNATPLSIATTIDSDPLKQLHADKSPAWRGLDVAIVQHLIVERICEPSFCGGGKVKWKFPHDLDELKSVTDGTNYQLGIIVQPTPLDAIAAVCGAGELMPQKSTFFYPKLATGLVFNPLS